MYSCQLYTVPSRCRVGIPHHHTVVGAHRLSAQDITLVCAVDPALARSQVQASVFTGAPGNARASASSCLPVAS